MFPAGGPPQRWPGRTLTPGRVLAALARARGIRQVGAALLLLALAIPLVRGFTPYPSSGPVRLGFTFSRAEAEYLGLSWRETYTDAMQLAPAFVRLGAYWNEIEPRPGEYDFASLDWMLDVAARRGDRVVLTVGMKAPRWPEYYVPSWAMPVGGFPTGARVSDNPELRARVLEFVATVVQRYAQRDVIAYWQVENEPLDPAGPHGWTIGADLLATEAQLVRSLDPLHRLIMVNMFVQTHPLMLLPPWRTELEARARTALNIADILGFDVYPEQPLWLRGSSINADWSGWAWEQPLLGLRDIAHQQGKETWVVEAQAEPWQLAGKPTLRLPWGDPSAGPSGAEQVLARLQRAGFSTILLWGVEHWQMRRSLHDDPHWWSLMEDLFATASVRDTPDAVSLPSPTDG